jgi:O-acetyl-ADP-ribose deacetylase (regulator of RNase III)/transposase InsO family protein
MSGRRPRPPITKAACNLISAYVNSVPTSVLIDTGATETMLSNKIFQLPVRKHKINPNGTEPVVQPEPCKLISANGSPLQVLGSVEVDIKLNGVIIPFSLIIVDDLAFDVILGMPFLQATRAVIDVSTNTLSIYDGLTSIPMTTRGTKVDAVFTVSNVKIPPRSEAVFPVASTIHRDGNYLIESDIQSECRSLAVARTLINPARGKLMCRVLNATDRPIRLRANTPIGMLSAVTVEPHSPKPPSANHQSLPSLADMTRALEAKGISFTQTTVTGKDRDNLIAMLYRNIDLFASDLKDLVGCDHMLMKINTRNNPPVRSRPYRHAPADRAEIARQVQEMLDANIIEEAMSPWSSPVILVRKKSGEARLCIDYRRVNSLTDLESWPLPTFTEVIDNLAEQQPTLFSTLDLKAGYWQAKLDPSTRDRSGFSTNDSSYIFHRIPFGLSVAVSFFQRLMTSVLRHLTPSTCLIYLDDVIVFGKNNSDMINKLQQVFDRFRENNLRIHPKKSIFSTDKCKFLGHVISADGIQLDDSKFNLVRDYQPCKNIKQVRQFLGLMNFYRKFIQSFSQISHPLRQLLTKDQPFIWTSECQQAFDELKNALVTAPVLALPRLDAPFIVRCDASTQGIGFILGQLDSAGRERIVSMGSRSLTPAETRYSISELECLALVSAIREFGPYLANQHFDVYTDHIALKYLQSMKLSSNNRLARWALQLQPFRFTIHYKPGHLMAAPDALSRADRAPVTQPLPSGEDRPTLGAIIAAADTPTTAREVIHLVYDSDPEPIAVVAPSSDRPVLPSLDDVRLALPSCPDFAHMFAYLSSDTLPVDDKAARRTLLDAPNYVLEEGVLFHLFSPRTKRLDRATAIIRQLCLPTSLRQAVMHGLHDLNGHAGVDRTYQVGRSRYFWPGMFVDIKSHVLTCQTCQVSKRPVHPNRTPIVPSPVPPPFTKFNLDWHGPYVESGGYRHVLVLIDCTSLWVELIPTKDCAADTAVSAIFDHIVARYGLPKEISILSDCAAAFTSRLTATFCKTFGIRQMFSVPHHPTTNHRAEAFGDVLNKTLRTLCETQSDWPRHLQSVAMSYRACENTATGLSPYMVLFGRPFPLLIDRALMLDELVGTPEQYAADIRPKLQVLHQVAMENALDSAANHARRYNSTATPPPFVVGDKVLLFTPVTKKHESAKLTRRFLGPYQITHCLDGYNYKLKHLETGKQMGRPVHAGRLRPYLEPGPDSLPSARASDYSCVTRYRTLETQVRVGDISQATTDVIVNPANASMRHDGGVAKCIARTAGDDLVIECRELVARNGPLSVSIPVITTSGKMTPRIQRVMHVVGPNAHEQPFIDQPLLADSKLEQCYYNCLQLADTNGLTSIAFPAISAGNYGMDKWSVSHGAAKALARFDEDTRHTPGSLRRIEFITSSLVTSGIMNIVFSRLFPPPPVTADTVEPDTDLPSSTSDHIGPLSTTNTGWFEIEKVLRSNRRNGKTLYLVKWRDSPDTSWVERKDLTDAAFQSFKATHPRRRRRRQ